MSLVVLTSIVLASEKIGIVQVVPVVTAFISVPLAVRDSASFTCCRRIIHRLDLSTSGNDDIDGSKVIDRRILLQRTVAATHAIVTVSATCSLQPRSTYAIVPDTRTSTSSQRAICDPAVLMFKKGNRILYIIGTAHISSASADLSRQLVREVDPDAVFIELDLKRIGRAFKEGRPSPGISIGYQNERGELKIGTVAEAPTTGPSAIIYKMLSKGADLLGKSIYKKLESSGFVPGAEFINAVDEGLNKGAVIVLGDRDMDVTLRRIAQALASTDPARLALVDQKLTATMKAKIPEMGEWQRSGAVSQDELKEFVEQLKTRDTTKLLMDIFKEEVPDIHYALVGERDLYMSRGIDKLSQFRSMVAVMGLGHLDGVSDNLQALGWSRVPKLC